MRSSPATAPRRPSPAHRGAPSPRSWAAAAAVAACALVVSASGAVHAAAPATAATNAATGSTTTAAPADDAAVRDPSQVLLDDGFDASRPAEPGSGYRVWTSRGVQLAPGSGQLDVTGLGPGASFSLAAPAVQSRDAVVSTTVTASPRGGSYYAGASVRVQQGGGRYAATVTVRPSGEVVLTTERVGGGSTAPLGRTTPPSSASAVGVPLRLELEATGTSPTTVRARVFPDGAPAPQWQLVGTDSSPEEITGAGGLAVAGYLSRSASSADVSLGALTAWSLDPSSAVPTVEPSVTPASSGPTTSAAPTVEPSSSAVPTVEPSSSAVPTVEPSSSAVPTVEPSSSAVPTVEPSVTPASSAPTTSAVPTTSASAALTGFQHPGVVVSSERLVFVRSQVAAGREPWTSALARARGSYYAKASWVPRPVAQVQCGAYNNPDIGCTAETDDAQAAYTNALLFSLTGERRYADKAVQILDAWSGVLQGHSFDTTRFKNGRLQAAWAAQTFTKAAELVRHSSAGWAPDRVERFERMLRTAFLPMVRDGWTGGGANWQLSMAEATMDIGVFLDDRSVFDDGVGDWRAQVVSAFYLTSDGPQPIPPAGTYVKPDRVPTYWYQPSAFVDGLGQETCRDLGHASMGLAAALNAAETAQIQGVDLYGEQRERLVAAMELTTRYLADPSASGWVCPQPPKSGGTAGALTYEIGLHHYATDDGLSLPSTAAWVERNRPSRTGIFMNWETLTHGS